MNKLKDEIVIEVRKQFINRKFLYTVAFLFALTFIFFIFIRYAVSINTGIAPEYITQPKQIDLVKLKAELKKDKEAEKRELLKKLLSVDLDTDTSIFKFVNPDVPFQNKGYVPKDMVAIDSEFVYDTKWNGKVREDVNIALQKMAEAFKGDLWRNLTIVSSYRSYLYQKGIKDRGCPDNLCAKAWHSEHQSGLAIDIASASTKAKWDNTPNLKEIYVWLEANATKYGFHNTYQKWLAVDGYEIEPWHWRYVGVEMAEYLKERWITLAEFYYERKKNS